MQTGSFEASTTQRSQEDKNQRLQNPAGKEQGLLLMEPQAAAQMKGAEVSARGAWSTGLGEGCPE